MYLSSEDYINIWLYFVFCLALGLMMVMSFLDFGIVFEHKYNKNG
ncbi:hypothetical protein [Leuconostoc pseudomesenteroides]|nr:hypothetical protein [Leuconostoc pseudomesenteroides]